MMNEKVHELLNQQINKEFYSAYLYLDFSNYFEEVGLDGFANWYKIRHRKSVTMQCFSISISKTRIKK